MSLGLKLCVAITSFLLLAGCDGDGAKDQSLKERMIRESICVVASERFALYKDAERHLKHGLDAAKESFRNTGVAATFLKQINISRTMLVAEPNDFVARLLADKCDTFATNGQVRDF